MLKSVVHGALSEVLSRLPLRAAIRLEFLVFHRRLPRLEHPKTFNEKIARRKLIDRDPRMPPLVDKIQAKSCVRELLGDEWVIPTLWSGEKLPDRSQRNWPYPYVLKASHSSGSNLFVHSAHDEDWDTIEKTTSEWLKSRYRPSLQEWAYSQIEPALLVEPFLGEFGVSPPDYKLWVFGGSVKFVQVDTDRLKNHQQYFYDTQWRKQSFRYICPVPKGDVAPPQSLDKMIWAAELLARPFPYVRVDLYEIGGKPLFGEMTFYPNSGRYPFKPGAVELEIGRLWPEGQPESWPKID